MAALDEGEAIKIRAIKEAEAEAARTEIQAKADAEAKYMAGQGISRQRQAIIAGLRDSVNSFKSEVQDVDAKSVMDLMVVTQCVSPDARLALQHASPTPLAMPCPEMLLHIYCALPPLPVPLNPKLPNATRADLA